MTFPRQLQRAITDIEKAQTLSDLEQNLRYIDIMFECIDRARKIVNRITGWQGPAFADDDFPTPRSKLLGEIADRLRAKQCAREGITYQPTFYDKRK